MLLEIGWDISTNGRVEYNSCNTCGAAPTSPVNVRLSTNVHVQKSARHRSHQTVVSNAILVTFGNDREMLGGPVL
jgi:hypothetical protein